MLNLASAIILTLYTAWSVFKSRYTDLLSTSLVQSDTGILTIQLLTTLSVLAVKESFIMSSKAFGCSLATNPSGINLLNFLVLSDTIRFPSLIHLLVALPWRLNAKLRLLALSRFVVLYILLIAAQFIWLFQIDYITTYKMDEKNNTFMVAPGFGAGVGPFELIQSHPLPFSRLSVWNYLADTRQVIQISPINCKPEEDPTCAAYVLIGYSNIVVESPDISRNDTESVVVLYDIPSYVVEFWSGEIPSALDDIDDPWPNCHNYTSNIGSYIRMCLGGVPRSTKSRDWRITAGWQFCLNEGNCNIAGTDEFNDTAFITTLSIETANITAIIDLKSGSIFDVFSIVNRSHYPVNITEFFAAFRSPLDFVPANVTRLLESDYLIKDEWEEIFNPIFPNLTHESAATAIADDMVDSLVYTFTSPLASQSPSHQLRGFLAHCLFRNSGLYNGSIVRGRGRQTRIFQISKWSLGAYVAINSSVLLACFCMLLRFLPIFKSNILLFHELTLSGEVSRQIMALFNDKIVTTESALNTLGDYQIFLQGEKNKNHAEWRVRVQESQTRRKRR